MRQETGVTSQETGGAVITELRLPQLADSVTSVTLSVWLKQEGDSVQAGEPIVEVETDKTNVELEAPASGVIRAIQVAAGTDGLEAGVLLAIIADDPASETVPPVAATPVPDDDQAGELDPGGAVAHSRSGPGEQPAALSEPARPTATPVAAGAPAPVASPIARRMAAAAGLDLSVISGTGRGGRIGKADIDRVLAAQRATAPAVSVEAPVRRPVIVKTRAPVGPDGAFQEQPLTAMRRVTATRMQQAKQTVPHFYCASNARRTRPSVSWPAPRRRALTSRPR